MSDEWAQVDNCNWLHQAHFIKSVLESEGIEVQLPDEYTIGVDPALANALGGIKVLVRTPDRERAEQLLKDIKAAEFPAEDDDPS